LLAASEQDPRLLAARVAAGFGFVLRVPDLNARRRDVPLLVRHVLRTAAERADEFAQRCFPARDWRAEPIVPLRVMRELCELDYTSNVRELKARLWQLLAAEQLGIEEEVLRRSSTPRPDQVEVAPAEAPRNTEPPAPSNSDEAAPFGLSAAIVQAALDQNNGVLEATWRALGLKNRFVLLRLIKRFDLEIRKRRPLSGAPPSRR